MTPKQIYQDQVLQGILKANPDQARVIDLLETTFHQLVKRQRKRNSLQGKVRRSIKPREPIQGAYIYGSVGVGKTRLVDLFFDCLHVNKLRVHFHEFMQDLHHKLKSCQGIKNPLQRIAKEIADEHVVICFDEFFVSNIADAMLLGELFSWLFKGGLCLIATSNIPPNDLYKYGLQRERFMPVILLIQQYTNIFHLHSNIDYRLEYVISAGVQFHPLNQQSEQKLKQCFDHFSHHKTQSHEMIELFGRNIPIVTQADTTIWLRFADICSPPRGKNDYLALAKFYHTIILDEIPVIDKNQSSQALLFIQLIDILYDQKIILITASAVPIQEIYPEGKLTFEFQRTQSRLTEMNSEAYIEQASNQS